MANSGGFSESLIKKLIESWTEGPRLDFKFTMYKLDSDHAKFEFARDIIAFSNIARRTGNLCWIVFGIQDDSHERNPNLIEQFPGRNPPRGWTNPRVTLQKKQSDGVEKVLREIAEDWVSPDPEFKLEYGWLDDQFISYLEITPRFPQIPFSLKKAFVDDPDENGNSRKFAKGSIFIRKNSSTCLLDPTNSSHLLTINEASYLHRYQWLDLIKYHTAGDFDKAESLFPRFHSRIDDGEERLEDLVIKELDSRRRKVIITGQAGMGKTVILQRLACQLARKHNLDSITRQSIFGGYERDIAKSEEIRYTTIDEIEVVPAFRIPVFFELRIAFDTIDRFEEALLSKIKNLTSNGNIRSIRSLFAIPGSKWVLLFDGIDEIRNRQEAAPKLRVWINSLPENVQVVITSRPHHIDRLNEEDSRFVEIPPLKVDEILFLLENKIRIAIASQEVDFPADELITKVTQVPNIPETLISQRAIDGLVDSLMSGSVEIFKPRIDQVHERIFVEEPVKFPASAAPAGQIPSVPEEALIPEDFPLDEIPELEPNDLDSRLKDQEESLFLPSIPPLASLIKSVADYVRHEEIKRRRDWGIDSRRLIRDSQSQLRKTAWQNDWSLSQFDVSVCIEKGLLNSSSLESCEDIGFIEAVDLQIYRYINRLYHKFFISEYGYQLPIDRLQRSIAEHDPEADSTKWVIELVNQLLIDNGRQPMTMDTGG